MTNTESGAVSVDDAAESTAQNAAPATLEHEAYRAQLEKWTLELIESKMNEDPTDQQLADFEHVVRTAADEVFSATSGEDSARRSKTYLQMVVNGKLFNTPGVVVNGNGGGEIINREEHMPTTASLQGEGDGVPGHTSADVVTGIPEAVTPEVPPLSPEWPDEEAFQKFITEALPWKDKLIAEGSSADIADSAMFALLDDARRYGRMTESDLKKKAATMSKFVRPALSSQAQDLEAPVVAAEAEAQLEQSPPPVKVGDEFSNLKFTQGKTVRVVSIEGNQVALEAVGAGWSSEDLENEFWLPVEDIHDASSDRVEDEVITEEIVPVAVVASEAATAPETPKEKAKLTSFADLARVREQIHTAKTIEPTADIEHVATPADDKVEISAGEKATWTEEDENAFLQVWDDKTKAERVRNQIADDEKDYSEVPVEETEDAKKKRLGNLRNLSVRKEDVEKFLAKTNARYEEMLMRRPEVVKVRKEPAPRKRDVEAGAAEITPDKGGAVGRLYDAMKNEGFVPDEELLRSLRKEEKGTKNKKWLDAQLRPYDERAAELGEQAREIDASRPDLADKTREPKDPNKFFADQYFRMNPVPEEMEGEEGRGVNSQIKSVLDLINSGDANKLSRDAEIFRKFEKVHGVAKYLKERDAREGIMVEKTEDKNVEVAPAPKVIRAQGEPVPVFKARKEDPVWEIPEHVLQNFANGPRERERAWATAQLTARGIEVRKGKSPGELLGREAPKTLELNENEKDIVDYFRQIEDLNDRIADAESRDDPSLSPEDKAEKVRSLIAERTLLVETMNSKEWVACAKDLMQNPAIAEILSSSGIKRGNWEIHEGMLDRSRQKDFKDTPEERAASDAYLKARTRLIEAGFPAILAIKLTDVASISEDAWQKAIAVEEAKTPPASVADLTPEELARLNELAAVRDPQVPPIPVLTDVVKHLTAVGADGIPVLTDEVADPALRAAVNQEIRNKEVAAYETRWNALPKEEQDKLTEEGKRRFRQWEFYDVKRTSSEIEGWILVNVFENGHARLSTPDAKAYKDVPLLELMELNPAPAELPAVFRSGRTGEKAVEGATASLSGQSEEQRAVENFENEGGALSPAERVKRTEGAEKISDRVATEFEATLKMSKEQLAGIEGFADLTEGQQLLALREYNKFSVSQIKGEALKDYRDQISRLGGLNDAEKNYIEKGTGPAWMRKFAVGAAQFFKKSTWKKVGMSIVKGKILADKEKELVAQLESAENPDKEQYLKAIVANTKEGPDAKFENGKMTLQFVKEADFGPMTDKEKGTVERFNEVAGRFMDTPHQWNEHGASDEDKAKYEAMKDQYKLALHDLLEIKAPRMGEKNAAVDMAGLEHKIMINQLFNSDPSTEVALAEIASQNSYLRLAKTLVGERGRAFAVGGLLRGAATLSTFAVAAPIALIAAPFIGRKVGAMTGRKNARIDLSERELIAKLGVKDDSEEAQKNIRDAGDLVKKISQLENRLNALPDTPENKEERDRISASLDARYFYTKDKVDKGLVSFGSGVEALKNRYELSKALGVAGTVPEFEKAWSAELRNRTEKEVAKVEMNIDAKQKQFIVERTKTGAKYGLIFGAAGALTFDIFHGATGGHSVVLDVANKIEDGVADALGGTPGSGVVAGAGAIRGLDAHPGAPGSPTSPSVEAGARLYAVKGGDNFTNVAKEQLSVMKGLTPQGQENVIQNLLKQLTDDERADIGFIYTDPNKLEIGQVLDVGKLEAIIAKHQVSGEGLVLHARKLFGTSPDAGDFPPGQPSAGESVAQMQQDAGRELAQSPLRSNEPLGDFIAQSGLGADTPNVTEGMPSASESVREFFAKTGTGVYTPQAQETLSSVVFDADKFPPYSTLTGRPIADIAPYLLKQCSPVELRGLGISSGNIEQIATADRVNLEGLYALLRTKEDADMLESTAWPFFSEHQTWVYTPEANETLLSVLSANEKFPPYSSFSGRSTAELAPDFLKQLSSAELRDLGVSSGRVDQISPDDHIDLDHMYRLMLKKENTLGVPPQVTENAPVGSLKTEPQLQTSVRGAVATPTPPPVPPRVGLTYPNDIANPRVMEVPPSPRGQVIEQYVNNPRIAEVDMRQAGERASFDRRWAEAFRNREESFRRYVSDIAESRNRGVYDAARNQGKNLGDILNSRFQGASGRTVVNGIVQEQTANAQRLGMNDQVANQQFTQAQADYARDIAQLRLQHDTEFARLTHQQAVEMHNVAGQPPPPVESAYRNMQAIDVINQARARTFPNQEFGDEIYEISQKGLIPKTGETAAAYAHRWGEYVTRYGGVDNGNALDRAFANTAFWSKAQFMTEAQVVADPAMRTTYQVDMQAAMNVMRAKGFKWDPTRETLGEVIGRYESSFR